MTKEHREAAAEIEALIEEVLMFKAIERQAKEVQAKERAAARN